MIDAYGQLINVYLSLISASSILGLDVSDPVMGDWFEEYLVDGAFVLDAGCGLGFDIIALHNGLPARKTGKAFNVYGIDYSASMLNEAVKRGRAAGINHSHYKQCSFTDLKNIQEWHGKFDCIMACHVIYTFPEEIGYVHYDEYLLSCIRGFDRVLKPGGSLLLNTRDWYSFIALGKTTFAHSNEHNGEHFTCRYEWEFADGVEGHHRATLRMFNTTTGKKHDTRIHFAGRTQQSLLGLFHLAGFYAAEVKAYGAEDERFITFILCRQADFAPAD